MIILTTVAELRALPRRGPVGFIPTMGALHAGHLSLVRTALSENATTIVSIFVNPTQFGPKSDFTKYPRPVESDIQLLRDIGASAVFCPSEAEIYPCQTATKLIPYGCALRWEGSARPGHFSGVVGVVMRLLHIVTPDQLYLGEKDFQQLAVIRDMVQDFHIPVTIRPIPTVRSDDGVALSSRLAYLSASGRQLARRIFASIQIGQQAAASTRSLRTIRARIRTHLTTPGIIIHYVAIVDPSTLRPPPHLTPSSHILIAVTIDGTRLIDNAPVYPDQSR